MIEMLCVGNTSKEIHRLARKQVKVLADSTSVRKSIRQATQYFPISMA